MSNPFDTIDARLSNIENLLLDLKHAPKEIKPAIAAAPTDELLTRKQAALFLKVSLPTLNELTKAGTLKGYRVTGSNRLRYKASEINGALTKIKPANLAA